MGEEFNRKFNKALDDAYKSIMMPIVGLGFSVLFMFLNIFAFLSLALLEYSKSGSRLATLSGYVLFFIIPMVYDVVDNKSGNKMIDEQNFLIETIYFYENAIMDNLSNSLLDDMAELPEPKEVNKTKEIEKLLNP